MRRSNLKLSILAFAALGVGDPSLFVVAELTRVTISSSASIVMKKHNQAIVHLYHVLLNYSAVGAVRYNHLNSTKSRHMSLRVT